MSVKVKDILVFKGGITLYPSKIYSAVQVARNRFMVHLNENVSCLVSKKNLKVV